MVERLLTKLSGVLRKPRLDAATSGEDAPIGETATLPLVHRLTILYLMLPVVV